MIRFTTALVVVACDPSSDTASNDPVAYTDPLPEPCGENAAFYVGREAPQPGAEVPGNYVFSVSGVGLDRVVVRRSDGAPLEQPVWTRRTWTNLGEHDESVLYASNPNFPGGVSLTVEVGFCEQARDFGDGPQLRQQEVMVRGPRRSLSDVPATVWLVPVPNAHALPALFDAGFDLFPSNSWVFVQFDRDAETGRGELTLAWTGPGDGVQDLCVPTQTAEVAEGDVLTAEFLHPTWPITLAEYAPVFTNPRALTFSGVVLSDGSLQDVQWSFSGRSGQFDLAAPVWLDGFCDEPAFCAPCADDPAALCTTTWSWIPDAPPVSTTIIRRTALEVADDPACAGYPPQPG